MTQDTPNAEQPSKDLVAEILRRDTEIRERAPVHVKPRSRLPWLLALLVVGIAVTAWNVIRLRRPVEVTRIAFTWKLVSWICSQVEPPRVLLSGSAIGFYGIGGEQALTEDSPAGTDWASTLVGDWEKATAPAASIGVRTVLLREMSAFCAIRICRCAP